MPPIASANEYASTAKQSACVVLIHDGLHAKGLMLHNTCVHHCTCRALQHTKLPTMWDRNSRLAAPQPLFMCHTALAVSKYYSAAGCAQQ